jgi:ubiquinone/menaquinone biosynthesis C-methylase UbiE
MNDPFADVAEAFSRTAEKYDRFAEDHPNLMRMRLRVYAHLLRYLPAGASILELNAGTGSDAVSLAQRGFRVHATDIAPGMLKRLEEKVERLGFDGRVSFQECSFTQLERLSGGPFDAVFSNLGGLNCTSDLSSVACGMLPLLRPGGLVTWVLMPPVCLWELAMALTGDLRFAFRRLAPNGTRAHLEGKYFTIYYFTPRQVIHALGPQFTPLVIEGLSIFAPPAESKNLAWRHPRLYNALCWLDERLCRIPPFRAWGDFYMITLRYQGE